MSKGKKNEMGKADKKTKISRVEKGYMKKTRFNEREIEMEKAKKEGKRTRKRRTKLINN